MKKTTQLYSLHILVVNVISATWIFPSSVIMLTSTLQFFKETFGTAKISFVFQYFIYNSADKTQSFI